MQGDVFLVANCGNVTQVKVDDAIRMSKALAKVCHWKGGCGGWIKDAAGRPVAQGWFGVAVKAITKGWIEADQTGGWSINSAAALAW